MPDNQQEKAAAARVHEAYMVKVGEGSYADIVSYYAVFDESGALNAHTPEEQLHV